jgi:hypothetical protein
MDGMMAKHAAPIHPSRFKNRIEGHVVNIYTCPTLSSTHDSRIDSIGLLYTSCASRSIHALADIESINTATTHARTEYLSK